MPWHLEHHHRNIRDVQSCVLHRGPRQNVEGFIFNVRASFLEEAIRPSGQMSRQASSERDKWAQAEASGYPTNPINRFPLNLKGLKARGFGLRIWVRSGRSRLGTRLHEVPRALIKGNVSDSKCRI